MNTSFAMGAPWFPFAGARMGHRRAHLIAEMTGRRGGPGGPGSWGAGGRGPGPWGMFGPGPQPFGPPWGGGRGWRGPKARRGDIRSAILSVLTDQSLNGYQIIQEIGDRSGGAWKPSPGSIYPTLAQLEDEGLVTADAAEGRRAFTLTEEGRKYATDHAEELAEPWRTFSESEEDNDGLKPVVGQVAAALWQLMAVGSPEQQARAKEAVTDLRRKLYAILAEDHQPSA